MEGKLTQVQSATDSWTSFRKVLQDRVSPVTWQTWLAPLDVRRPVESELTLVAPSDFHRRWISEKHREAIEDAALATFGPDVDVQFETGTMTLPFDEEPELELAEPEPALPARIRDRSLNRPGSRLLPRYTFEHFVVGQSNRFAHAAAMAVAEQPGTHYNPLFIYGGAGLGKTHLLQAVGHHALELDQHCVVRYVSSENFFNEFIEGIRSKRMDEFKTRYRTTDVLLLDDVQFFEGKEQLLEEFFHTFNNLYESGKQMVFSSDRHPRHLTPSRIVSGAGSSGAYRPTSSPPTSRRAWRFFVCTRNRWVARCRRMSFCSSQRTSRTTFESWKELSHE